jgi:hypothetical protein
MLARSHCWAASDLAQAPAAVRGHTQNQVVGWCKSIDQITAEETHTTPQPARTHAHTVPNELPRHVPVKTAGVAGRRAVDARKGHLQLLRLQQARAPHGGGPHLRNEGGGRVLIDDVGALQHVERGLRGDEAGAADGGGGGRRL